MPEICEKCQQEISITKQACKDCLGVGLIYTPDPAEPLNLAKRKQKSCARCNGGGREISAKNRNNRSRGNANERRLAKILAEWWIRDGKKYDFQRSPQSGGSKLKEGFDMAGDITTNAPDWPFHVEAKREAGWDILQLLTTDAGGRIGKYWEQARHDCPPNKVPLIIMSHPEGTLQYVMMDFNYGIDLLCRYGIKYLSHNSLYLVISLNSLTSIGPDAILAHTKFTTLLKDIPRETNNATSPSNNTQCS